jgi:hypothetical protein
VERTFATGKDVLGWDQRQARTWYGICRHTALAAVAQLRQAAIHNAICGDITLPPAPADDVGQPGPGGDHDDDDHISDTDLQIPRRDAPVPARGGQPCPPRIAAIGLTIAEAARLDRLARQYAAGSSPAPASPFTCDGLGGAASTRPGHGGTTTAPAFSPQPPPDPGQPKGCFASEFRHKDRAPCGSQRPMAWSAL